MNHAHVIARRRRLLKTIGDGVAIIPTAPEVVRNRDAHYPYRFDSYDEKYSSGSGSTTRLDVTDLSAEQVETIRHLALKAFRQLKLKDLSRVDFFLTAEGEILLNEINTFPGMTPISMFPKMLQHHGHDFGQFLHQRILAAVGQ